MANNDRSRHVTQGDVRAPNRAMYYPMGYTRADFDKPMIGVANGHSTITPCNSGLQKLTDAAIDAIEAAGAKAQVFGTPTVSDAVSMGTEGMKYSLVSREVIADCIETAVMGQWMDGCVVVGGCDKNMPGAMIAMARMNIPSLISVYGGTIKPGFVDNGTDADHRVGRLKRSAPSTRGKMSRRSDFDRRSRKTPAPVTAGSCGGMYTANTMSLCVRGTRHVADGLLFRWPTPIPRRATACRRVGPCAGRMRSRLGIVGRATGGHEEERSRTRLSLVMATGGSTNAVLHFLAIAHAAGVEMETSADFERVRQTHAGAV